MIRTGNETMNRKQLGCLKRHGRVRKKVHGTAERPRLCIFRSLKYIYVQVINDDVGHTFAAASSLEKALKTGLKSTDDTEAAKQVGAIIAKRALEVGITKVVFDRGGYLYHGRVKALADAAREGGLDF